MRIIVSWRIKFLRIGISFPPSGPRFARRSRPPHRSHLARQSPPAHRPHSARLHGWIQKGGAGRCNGKEYAPNSFAKLKRNPEISLGHALPCNCKQTFPIQNVKLSFCAKEMANCHKLLGAAGRAFAPDALPPKPPVPAGRLRPTAGHTRSTGHRQPTSRSARRSHSFKRSTPAIQ